MDRRSFMKGAAAAVAIAPVAAAAAPPQAIDATGLSAIDAELGTCVAGQIADGAITAPKFASWPFGKVEGAMNTWMRMACDLGIPKHEDYVAARRYYEELYADEAA